MSVRYLAQERPASPAPAIATRIYLVKTSLIQFTFFLLLLLYKLLQISATSHLLFLIPFA
ncbi:MAG: hypothetical protein F6K54_35860 [Okeania sp. SIO3B5]|uniref:hypothetical protein n=1 Tax=Okeania sp. SIO3B5 TaxID=2607811 RepID=UPI001400EAB8|nr:hypothetical protein [Okeania sp. SIO3B5]NEO57964.1 hypothetical protein [Okeania sp. SIO3B5]